MCLCVARCVCACVCVCVCVSVAGVSLTLNCLCDVADMVRSNRLHVSYMNTHTHTHHITSHHITHGADRTKVSMQDNPAYITINDSSMQRL